MYKYDAFGRKYFETGPPVVDEFAYTARQRHDRTGLYYYRNRFYYPQLGRFMTQDPIGISGGTNLYAYVGNSPVNFIDPLGLHSVTFDGKMVTARDDNGEIIFSSRGTSGKIGKMNPKYQKCPNVGPIPEGEYSFDPGDFSKAGIYRTLQWYFRGIDWGTYRVPLTPSPDTKSKFEGWGRTGDFFIHGGRVEGSAGCIDIGNKDIEFYDKLRDHNGDVDVTVDYSGW